MKYTYYMESESESEKSKNFQIFSETHQLVRRHLS